MLMCVQAPSPGARVVYIDGAFDLFHAGHVEVPFAVLVQIMFLITDKCWSLVWFICYH